MIHKIKIRLLTLLLILPFISSCKTWNNFSTFYNLFWNIERIDKEIADETDYIRDESNPQPSFYIPNDDDQSKGLGYYPHLEKRTLNEKEKQSNKIKLDSILIKGSKLLSRNTNSDYLDGALFYIGKSYFYLGDYFQSQRKFAELVNTNPRSTYIPQGHLYWAMDLLKQAKPDSAKIQISRAIDAAFYHKQKNVLTEAYRLNADIDINNGDIEGALKPYYKALTLSSNNEESARWQYEIGLIQYRGGNFEKSILEFEKVKNYSPNDLTKFETLLQQAVAYRVLNKYNNAQMNLDIILNDDNFFKWKGLAEIEEVNLNSSRSGVELLTEEKLKYFDTTYKDKPYSMYGLYERGVRALRTGDYNSAWMNFTRTQNANTQFQKRARKYTNLLGYYLEQQKRINSLEQVRSKSQISDSIDVKQSEALYNIARTFNALNKKDSMQLYYQFALQKATKGTYQSGQIIYAIAMNHLENGKYNIADSLLQELVDNYQLTEFAQDARLRLGYTDYAKTDTALDLYVSGLSLMRVGEKEKALSQFNKIILNYSNSDIAPQTYYAIGLLFEEQFSFLDSAFITYQNLLDIFPKSPQAIAIKPIIDAVLNARLKFNGSLDPMKLDSLMRVGKIGLIPNRETYTGDPLDKMIPLFKSDDINFDHSEDYLNNNIDSKTKPKTIDSVIQPIIKNKAIKGKKMMLNFYQFKPNQ